MKGLLASSIQQLATGSVSNEKSVAVGQINICYGSWGTLVYVGCHNVEQNPSPEGSKAYLLLSELDKGDKLYLQQIDHKGRADVTVGSPCK